MQSNVVHVLFVHVLLNCILIVAIHENIYFYVIFTELNKAGWHILPGDTYAPLNWVIIGSGNGM